MSLLVMLVLVGCKSEPEWQDEGVGLVGDHVLNPFPTRALLDAQGHLALPSDQFPKVDTALPTDRLSFRTGFSPAQTAVLHLESFDTTVALPGPLEEEREGSVRLLDRTAGGWLPVMAEFDAHPSAAVAPSLLIRPLRALPVGHDIAVVVTTEVTPRPERFQRAIDGQALNGVATDVDAVLADVERAGLSIDRVAIAWDFPVGDGTTPTRSMWSQVELDGGYAFDRIRSLDQGDQVAPLTFRVAEGTYTVQDFLVDDWFLNQSRDGSVAPTGTAQAELYVHIPQSVADAEPGTVPVMLFGHGIFSEPARYLDEGDDPNALLALADAGGFIVVSTLWRGLNWRDRADALAVAQDFGNLPSISDRLVQGQANVATLARLVKEGDLLRDEVFRGRHGELLANPDQLVYYGISLGGIEGAVSLAADPPYDAVVLHVGGASWSTMLERSSNWPLFEALVEATIEDPWERQVSYAASQLYWDMADPISYVDALSQKDFLLQEAIGDEQVPNLTTESLARSVGLPLVVPSATTPFGLDAQSAPYAGRGLSQFDPETELPAMENRPAAVTHAHTDPRLWPTTQAQTLRYLDPEDPNQIIHPCGDSPCTASNAETVTP